jgi:galactokinase
MMTIPPQVANRIREVQGPAFGDDQQSSRFVGAPGRIEVIGNHLDYNGGPVLAAAIDRHVVVGIRDVPGQVSIRADFADFAGEFAHVLPDIAHDWRNPSHSLRSADYLRGAVAALYARGHDVRTGLELVVAGDLPYGVGISSSAALCVALVLALARETPTPHDIVLIAQEAENRAGSPCGTMDQSASVFGGLIRYEGSDNTVRTVAADLAGHQFVVVNSGVVRTLAGSAYPERVHETQAALAILRDRWRKDLPALGAIELPDMDAALALLDSTGNGRLGHRVRHIVTEAQRVRDAERAITERDWAEVGRLMTASGHSSATDYDISHHRVERVVSLCLDVPGVLGARMMGGGQGGSALVLARDDSVDDLRDRLDRDYFSGLPESPSVRMIPCTFAPGAGPMVSG